MNVKIKVRKMHPAACMPFYATPDSMCFDLRLCSPGKRVIVNPGERKLLATGLAFQPEAGWGINVFSRSGHGHKLGVSLANSVGKIDPDYTGEVFLSVANHGMNPVAFQHGAAIAQGEPVEVHRAVFEEVGVLAETPRGAGGFGSTDVPKTMSPGFRERLEASRARGGFLR